MSCLTAGGGLTCTRWVMFASAFASAVAAFMLVSRLRRAGPHTPDEWDEINGM